MSSILFTHSYFLRFDAKQWKLGQPYAPLGTLYAASLLRREGFAVALHDVQFAESADSLQPVLLRERPDIVVIYDDGFNYLTKMCLTNMRDAAFRMIALAKARGCVVIVHSSDATDHYEQYLGAGADFVILGEGEQTLLELVQSLRNEETEQGSIKGLAFLWEGGLLKTAPRAVLRDLDTLPLPAWDLIDFAPYRAAWMQSSGYFSINIATTRGCPYKCNWCAKPIYGNRYNVRSSERVLEEIRLLQACTDFQHIWFCDDIFGLKPGWVEGFAQLLAEAGIRIPFKIQSRADLLLQPDYVASLAKAGCATVWMGAESGSQAILDAMDKGITVAQVEGATGMLRAHQIDPCFFIQFGYLGETRSDIRATIKMINRLRPSEIGISVSYPLPGTGFYEKVRSQLREKTNWSDSDDLALMYRDPATARYYRRLHRYVHRQYGQRKKLRELAGLLRQPERIRGSMLHHLASLLLHAPALFLNRLQLHYLQKNL
jgi:anaerobic magnesium-protoporphyrin IX monomethyl ester cyclase